ncbi:sensor histidine kinase [Blastococcus sp. TF02A-26]|uniref:sensor histidine kinase n=1 Tax=Blastococcus sp. TF02A-26 TaxID=2250577 RepID=UPI000DE8292B|nr:sensor histidine kinase [Blastococcus sp. TF02A-26]RBY85376.1 sensor histidine kinase [Blastococcus sp. TF02A-26]
MSWRPGRLDVVLVLASVLPAWAALAGHLEPEARPTDALGFALCAVVGLPMLVARRAPVPALFASIALLYGFYLTGYSAVGLALPLAPALFVVALSGRLRLGAVTAGTGLALSSVFRLISDGQNEKAGLIAYDGALSLALMAAVLALGDAVRSRRGWSAELAERLRRADEEREAHARRLVDEERMRIARDVHDSLGHAVAVVTLHAAVAAEALDDGRPAAARRAVDTIRAVSRDVLGDLRDTVGLLRGEPSDGPCRTRGLADVPDLVAATAAAGVDVRLVVDGDPRPLPAAVEATAHRVVQEALTNVLRHADASTATVTVAHDTDSLTVTVADDGRGSGGADGTGHGLEGMRERVALLGGRLLAADRPGGGFAVSALLPVAPGRVRTPA